MNEKLNNDEENNNFQGQKENVAEKIEQENNETISNEESLENNETANNEESSENNETASNEESSESNGTTSGESSAETIDSLKKELSENKDKLLRSMADSENTRKQMEKIRIETNKYGVQPLAREILNVVDNFNRALNLKNDNNEKGLEEGLALIQKEILRSQDREDLMV